VNCIGGVGLARARRPFPKLPELQDEVTAAVVMDTRQWSQVPTYNQQSDIDHAQFHSIKNKSSRKSSPSSAAEQHNRRSQITSLVLAILFTSHSALAATTPAPTPTCDEYFYLSGKPGEAMCRSNHVTYTCPLDKCKVDNKDWASATFTKCDLLDKPRGNVIPGRQKESIVPMQYHVQNTGVEVQNQGDRFWYRCVSTVTDRSNDHRAMCTACQKV
ncbi:hypothetical protein H4Q26_008142, partial [Puccinia striiformis f. sp. tritici PST-130]